MVVSQLRLLQTQRIPLTTAPSSSSTARPPPPPLLLSASSSSTSPPPWRSGSHRRSRMITRPRSNHLLTFPRSPIAPKPDHRRRHLLLPPTLQKTIHRCSRGPT
ncbi:hypothetical protein KSP40_PGU019556 [Platanthera guangdongensis]|uniref:Uncharacterized protein n=1 Tax=Platanthera guangdongensis TaxID=2320717 RepID=A0ABR2N126_9ASPA